MKYIAKLTGNRRDINTGSPKALLIDVVGFYRNHCWVDITEELEKLQPAGHQKPITVEIVGKLVNYIKQGKEDKITISIKHIKRIKHKA